MFGGDGGNELTIVDPDDNVLPVVPVTTIAATSRDLVLREVPGVHDRIAALVPGTTNVGLAVGWIVTAAAGTAGVVETTADLAGGAHSRIGLTSMSDVQVRFVTANCVALSTTAEVLRDVLDAAVRDNREVGVDPLGQEVLGVSERRCGSACDEEEE